MHVSPPRALIGAAALATLCAAASVVAARGAFDVGPVRPARPAAPEGGAVPGFLRPVLEPIASAQRDLNRTVSRELRAIRESGSPRALLLVTGVAFVYGVLHAAGPGHGKLVVSSFFLARHARVAAGILAGTTISFLQAVTSIVLVGGLGVVLGQNGFDVLGRSVWLEALSYALVVAIGLAIAASAVRGTHHHEIHDRPHIGIGMVVAAGITPCASALIIMLFALTNSVLLIGVGLTLVMAVGMSLTTSLVGILAIIGRRTLMTALPGGARLRGRVVMALSIAGGVIIAVVGGVLLAGAWARLG
jgi:ABC-type nickel/cobalt efflux system permease component RcnA